MFYGVWSLGSNPNPYEPCHCTCCNNQHNIVPYPQEVCGFFNISMPKEKCCDIPCWNCHDTRRWKHGIGCHERNPWGFLGMFNKMRRRREHCACCPAPHGYDGWRTWMRPMSPTALWFCSTIPCPHPALFRYPQSSKEESLVTIFLLKRREGSNIQKNSKIIAKKIGIILVFGMYLLIGAFLRKILKFIKIATI